MRIKRLLALALTVVMFASLCVFASAEDEATAPAGVMQGTPTIDGVIDDAFLASISFKMLQNAFWDTSYTGAYTDFENHNATIYALWNGEYLYIAADVLDDVIVSRGEEYCANTENAWENDCVEVYVKIGDTKTKVQVDAKGLKCAILDSELFDASATDYAVVENESGWTVEVALKLAEGAFEAESEIAFGIQLNDIRTSDGTDFTSCQGCAMGVDAGQANNVTKLVSCTHANTVEGDVTEPTCADAGKEADTLCADCGAVVAEGDEIPATGEHTFVDGACSVCGAKEGTPATGDALVVSVAALAVACGAAVVYANSKKKED